MFCFQCQEAAKGTGCTIKGVCGKSDDVANLQDLLMFVLKGISIYSEKAREKRIESAEVNKFVTDSLFATITNANFDRAVFIKRVHEGLKLRAEMKSICEQAGVTFNETNLHESATWFADSEEAFDAKAVEVGVLSTENEDVRSLRELLIYGLKGMAAYTEHAFNLGFERSEERRVG